MKRLLTLAGAAPALVALVTMAQAELGGAMPGIEMIDADSSIGALEMSESVVVAQAAPRVTCTVDGKPVEFPNDLKFVNNGSTVIPAGSQLSWQVPSVKMGGQYVLKTAFHPGTMVWAEKVLKHPVEAGRPCSVRVRIKLPRRES
jgi:hypothetical protein